MTAPFAPRLHRLGAYLVDLSFGMVSTGLGLSIGGWLGDLLSSDRSSLNDDNLGSALLGGLIAGLASWAVNYGFLQGVHGASLGKQLLKLKVVNEDGSPLGIARSLYRSYTYLASALPLGVGFAAIFFEEKDQCWHDRICRTVVLPRDAVYPESLRSSFPYSYSA